MTDLAGPLTKRCPMCATVKLLSDFYRDHMSRDGWGSWCADCTREAVRGKAYNRARYAAIKRLNRAQFDALVAVEWDAIRREEGLP